MATTTTDDASRKPGELEQILYTMRAFVESDYRNRLEEENVDRVFMPLVSDDGRTMDKTRLASGGHLLSSGMGYEGILGCGNKHVAIYVFPSDLYVPGAHLKTRKPSLFKNLHRYLEKMHFPRPRTSIDCDEFVAKVIAPRIPPSKTLGADDLPETSNDDYVDFALVLNRAICDTFDQAQLALENSRPHSPWKTRHITPLFRAFAIMLMEDDYDYLCLGDNPDPSELEKVWVHLISTGDAARLNDILEFDMVSRQTDLGLCTVHQLTLGEALAIIKARAIQERRATPTAPLEPVTVANNPRVHRFPSALSSLPWHFVKRIPLRAGPITGPSSTWVNPKKFTYTTEFQLRSRMEIVRFKSSAEGQAWQSQQRKQWLIFWQDWHWWYTNLSEEERERTNGRLPDKEVDSDSELSDVGHLIEEGYLLEDFQLY